MLVPAGLSGSPGEKSGIIEERAVVMEFRIRRIYDPPTGEDGFRVLVDRLWPRGLTKQAARIDLWAKELAPSTELRKRLHADPTRRQEFARDDQRELKAQQAAVRAALESMPGPVVTLLTATKDPESGHAGLLGRFLQRLADRSS